MAKLTHSETIETDMVAVVRVGKDGAISAQISGSSEYAPGASASASVNIPEPYLMGIAKLLDDAMADEKVQSSLGRALARSKSEGLRVALIHRDKAVGGDGKGKTSGAVVAEKEKR